MQITGKKVKLARQRSKVSSGNGVLQVNQNSSSEATWSPHEPRADNKAVVVAELAWQVVTHRVR